jgi:hypothetical protein
LLLAKLEASEKRQAELATAFETFQKQMTARAEPVAPPPVTPAAAAPPSVAPPAHMEEDRTSEQEPTKRLSEEDQSRKGKARRMGHPEAESSLASFKKFLLNPEISEATKMELARCWDQREREQEEETKEAKSIKEGELHKVSELLALSGLQDEEIKKLTRVFDGRSMEDIRLVQQALHARAEAGRSAAASSESSEAARLRAMYLAPPIRRTVKASEASYARGAGTRGAPSGMVPGFDSELKGMWAPATSGSLAASFMEQK